MTETTTSPGEARLALFETAIGSCGIAFDERAVIGVTFPEATPERTVARLRRDAPGARVGEPPAQVERAIDAIRRLLAGEAADLRWVDLDLDRVDPFDRRVLRAAREIPPGETVTYGELARRIGEPDGARDVGGALGRNPFPIIVPCHRVVAANGKLGGFSARGGTETKRRLLSIEAPHGGPATLFGSA